MPEDVAKAGGAPNLGSKPVQGGRSAIDPVLKSSEDGKHRLETGIRIDHL